MEYEEIKKQMKITLMEQMNFSKETSDKEILELIDEEILSSNVYGYLPLAVKEKLRQELFFSIRKLDVLQELIENDEITEIMINGPDKIFIEKDGQITLWGRTFESMEKLEDVIQQIVAKSNRVVNESSPIVDARLENGARVNVVMRPVALNGPIVTIRRFPDSPLTMKDLISLEAITEEAADFLNGLVKAGYNIFISGGTGSGKTTFLNVLSEFIPATERIITIEDSAELQLRHIQNLVSLETRNANIEGCKAISIRDLIKSALRMRPDRIIVRRSDYHSEEQVLSLTASSNQYKEKVEILVTPMHYTEEEIKEVFEEVKDEVMNELTESEETLSHVQSNLHFIDQSSKYPVQIQFQSNNDEVVAADGTVHNEELLKEEIVTLTIKLSYHDLKQEYEIPLLVVPKEYTKEQVFIRSLLKKINANEKEQRTSKYLKLPDEVENMNVTYEEIKENPAGTILVVLIVTIVFLYLSKDKELMKQIHNRKRELQMEYPEFISKFTLLIGAGMPIKAALFRLTYDYKQQINNGAPKKHVYEELLVTIHEMESGMIEEAAYEAFGKRCSEVNYIKFSGLLIQNKKRGGKKLIELLEKEVKEAFEERKNQSRRLGEEAGTKLLIPMMIMLGVVMTLVIIPAFLSYQ